MTPTVPAPLRVYIAGPYSADDPVTVEQNVLNAEKAASVILLRGHQVFCPHTATHRLHMLTQCVIPYERWIEFDLSIIERWASALYVIAESPGVLREIAAAKAKPIPIYRTLDEVPEVKP